MKFHKSMNSEWILSQVCFKHSKPTPWDLDMYGLLETLYHTQCFISLENM